MRSAVVAILVGAVVADHMEAKAGFGSDYNCPGSGSLVHARMKVTVQANASCADVEAEIQARANGAWTDPHNGGIYSLLSRVNQSDPDSDSQRDQFYKNVVIDTQRTSNPATAVGGKLYTDKQTFELNTADGGCQIKACSDSQGFSIGDFSTNYCDLRNLYCGSSDGCVTAVRDFAHYEISHANPLGSGHDSSLCNVDDRIRTTPRTTPAPKAAPLSIVATAHATPDLSSLVDALVQADLVDALSGDGPFTVFAPTNEAFDAISSVVGGLTMEQLQQVLEYHVVSGPALQQSLPYWARDIGFPFTNFTDMQVLMPLFSGHSLSVDLEGGNVRITGEINTVTVSVADVLCTNGVVHIVDAVLIPNLELAPAVPMSIVETAQATPDLSSLVDALVQADLVDALSGDGPFTVFAPTNEAFDAISSVVGGLTMEQLQQVLEYHVVSGPALQQSLPYWAIDIGFPFTNFTDMQVLMPLFSGHSLSVDLEGGNVRITGETNTVTVSVADVLCTNGVVHIVDAVLFPNLALAAAAPMSIVETAQATPELSSLVGALVQADLVDALSGDGPFTVFAPTNEAFDAISSVVAGLTMEQLQQVLEYHVVSGAAVKSSDLTNMQVILPLYSGHSLGVDLEEVPNVRIVGENNAVTVSVANVLCTNGVVHIVDAVLIPNLARVISV